MTSVLRTSVAAAAWLVAGAAGAAAWVAYGRPTLALLLGALQVCG